MLTKRTKTTETFILPEEFDTYSKKDFVIFMSRPTSFGTYKAVKIELLEEQMQQPVNDFLFRNKEQVKTSKLFNLWNLLSPQF